MKVVELIEELTRFPPKAEVTISDGYEYIFYHTNGIDITQPEPMVVDIGVGGCAIDDDTDMDGEDYA